MTLSIEQRGSIVFALEQLGRALAEDDAAPVVLVRTQLAAMFPALTPEARAEAQAVLDEVARRLLREEVDAADAETGSERSSRSLWAEDEDPSPERLREVLSLPREERHEYVNRDGTLRVDGVRVGGVFKLDQPGPGGTKWRAEVGDPKDVATFAASYAKTRSAAVEEVFDHGVRDDDASSEESS